MLAVVFFLWGGGRGFVNEWMEMNLDKWEGGGSGVGGGIQTGGLQPSAFPDCLGGGLPSSKYARCER